MAEISNNVLAVLLVLAIVVSMFGIATMSTILYIPGAPITGVATAGGKVNLSIQESVGLVLLRNETIFGDGFPNADTGGTLLAASNASEACGGLGPTNCFNNGSEGNGTDYGAGAQLAYPFVARILGNDVTTCLRIQAANTAEAFLGPGDTTATFKYAGRNNESILTGEDADSCYGTLNTTWDDVAITANWVTVCDTVNSSEENNEVRVHWQLGIPEETTATGTRSNTITVCAAGDCGSC